MAKVMLVEDDNNLREIYDARLAAEGYEIVSAHDGEEALALAVKEKPDLIISDVMMPKISGFDMLDILRSTPETKNTKVIMMTALSQAEDRARADKLGADRYLIKSQVTLEDVIKVAHEVLEDSDSTPTPPITADTQDVPVAPAPVDEPATTEPSTAVPVVEPPVEPAATADEPVVVTPPANDEPVTAPVIVEPPADTPVDDTPEPTDAPAPAADEPADDAAGSSTTPPADEPATVPEPTIIQPTAPVEKTPAEAEAPVQAADPQTEATETDGVEKQIQDFITNNPKLNSDDKKDETPTSAPTISPAQSGAPKPTENAAEEALANPTATSIPVNSVEPPSHQKLVLQPTDAAMAPAVDLEAMAKKEEEKAASAPAVPAPEPATPPAAPSGPNPNDIAL